MFLEKFNYADESTLDESGEWGLGAEDFVIDDHTYAFLVLVSALAPEVPVKTIYGRSIFHRNHNVHLDYDTVFPPANPPIVGSWVSSVDMILRSDAAMQNYYFGRVVEIQQPFSSSTRQRDWYIGKVVNGVETILDTLKDAGALAQQCVVCGNHIEMFNPTSSLRLRAEDNDIESGGYAGFGFNELMDYVGTAVSPRVVPAWPGGWDQTCCNDRVFLVVEEATGLIYPCSELNAGPDEQFNIVYGAHDFSLYDTTRLGNGVMRLGALA